MSDLIERINAAICRIANGDGTMRVPAEDTDPDLVLADCEKEIKRLCGALVAKEVECDRLREALLAAGLDDPDALRYGCEECDGEESQCPCSCWVRRGIAALDVSKPKEPKS